ncbi:M20/M25/M40 family metallo-hydrolase [Pendulispora albinea]|uniref:M20/M25/M40 family metallo-hydrolase n=1 Tax=Pendulispora albinea TaxID=2741071 RepID=A0ABZ2LWD1_9BACT
MEHASEVELLRCMLEIASPSGGEAELSAYLTRYARANGVSARQDEVGNFLATVGTGVGPTIVLMSHLDTSGRPLPARISHGLVFGRGAVDAKGPLGAMVSAALRLRDFPGTLVVAGVVEEETAESRGANHLVRTMPAPDAVIVGEPSGASTVVLGYKGQVALEYEVHKPATHPTNPREKAAEAAAGFWAAVRARFEARETPAFRETTMTLSRFEGDATDATLAIDCRIGPGCDTAALVDELRMLAQGAALRVRHRIPAVQVDRHDPVVRALTAAIRAHGGRPQHKLKTATSDMNTVAPHWRIPMATYGPGDSTLDHSDDEHIAVGEYRSGIEVLTAAIRQLAAELGARQDRTPDGRTPELGTAP